MDSEVEQLLRQAESLLVRFQQGDGSNYIDEAIVLDRKALELCPPGDPKRPISLNSLANDLWDRYNQLGRMMDLDEAIVLNREALELRPPGHSDRSRSLNSLAICLAIRYSRLGKMENLNDAIVLTRDALVLRPPGHPDRPTSLSNLGAYLSTRHNQLGNVADLEEAITLDREVLALRPPGHPDRSLSLNNLAVHLFARYKQFGGMGDLNEVIVLDRDALALRPPGHVDRSTSLNNLAVRLSARYEQLGAMEDLNEAIALDRAALELYPPGHPDRSMSLNNLSIDLSNRYKKLGEIGDLHESIALDRDALTHRPPGHPDRPGSLNNLANRLSTRYNNLKEVKDLDEAIALDREALALHPPGHADRSASLSNLAIDLFIRYDDIGAPEDIDEAIRLNREAMAIYPPGHPRRSSSLRCLACSLYLRFTKLNEVQDKEELFSLYAQLEQVSQTVSSADVSAARAWINAAEALHHPSALLAYETSLRLLIHHIASLPSLPQHLDLLKTLTSSLAVDAFSACLRNHAPTKAVELLEQGRGVFWSQLTRLRSPLEDVIASGPEGKLLADKYTQLTSHIHDTFNSPGADQHDQLCRLNVELQAVVNDIRALPSLLRFLLPSPFSDLQQAASEGPVIIVNASEYSCDALVVLVDQDPVHIPLPITKERVRQLSSTFHTFTVRAKTMNVTSHFALILREVWDDVVSHIVDFLRPRLPRGSRIWWCPTAEFSLLPLHAAGQYRKGQPNLAHIYISSYTPTLTALIRARRPAPPLSGDNLRCLVAVGQANPSGQNELPSVGAELAKIGHRMEALATFTRIEGPESSISRFAEELGKNEWVHLACHGLPNQKQPFESAFALYDGHFTIQHIIQCNLENPQFAYLSACHTTVGDEESPDEVIHLASAMQFAGFRSVIGTMWAVDDGQTNKITSMFYDNMVDESGRLDHTRAARALHRTMRTLVDVPFDQRILYIHLGA